MNDGQQRTARDDNPVPIETAPLAEFKCHKVVRAGWIVGFLPKAPDSTDLTFRLSGALSHTTVDVTVPKDVFARGMPTPGDFLVVYPSGGPDGGAHISWSPHRVFKDGYAECTPGVIQDTSHQAVEIDRLAAFLLEKYSSVIEGSAVDTAIKLLKRPAWTELARLATYLNMRGFFRNGETPVDAALRALEPSDKAEPEVLSAPHRIFYGGHAAAAAAESDKAAPVLGHRDDQALDAAIAELPGEKVTKPQMDARIQEVKYHRLGLTLTHCTILLDNGFSVTGESACVDPANYRQEICERIAYDNAYDKLWQLFGFLLAERRHLASRPSAT